MLRKSMIMQVILINKVSSMLTLNKIKEDERIISYEYLPQDDLKKGKGIVTLNKKIQMLLILYYLKMKY